VGSRSRLELPEDVDPGRNCLPDAETLIPISSHRRMTSLTRLARAVPLSHVIDDLIRASISTRHPPPPPPVSYRHRHTAVMSDLLDFLRTHEEAFRR
jgi:hypothetical protein